MVQIYRIYLFLKFEITWPDQELGFSSSYLSLASSFSKVKNLPLKRFRKTIIVLSIQLGQLYLFAGQHHPFGPDRTFFCTADFDR